MVDKFIDLRFNTVLICLQSALQHYIIHYNCYSSSCNCNLVMVMIAIGSSSTVAQLRKILTGPINIPSLHSSPLNLPLDHFSDRKRFCMFRLVSANRLRGPALTANQSGDVGSRRCAVR